MRTMAKTSTLSKSARSNWGLGGHGQDAEFPSAPTRVSEDAQSNKTNVNPSQQFDFGRRDRNKLLERPSTSGGSSKKISMRGNGAKRETQDDLHFNPLAVHGKETTFYNFPLPGTLPTPSPTPKSSPPPPSKPSKSEEVGSNTPESMDSRPPIMNLQPAEIGMALGSPTHQPITWQPQSNYESTTRSLSPDIASSAGGYTDPPALLKNKPSKWKMLGGLFGGGKKQSNPQAFYQLQPEPTYQTTVEAISVDSGEFPPNEKVSTKSRSRGRSNSSVKKNGKQKHRPDLGRANTAPPQNLGSQLDEGRMQTATPEITIDGPMMSETNHTQGSQNGGLLNVDIPSIQMERYSIMFGSVLQKSTNAPSSSLLARRQATLDRLKTVNEALALKERELEEKSRQLRTRRATSPQPTRSPAFSLFPSTPSKLAVRSASPGPRSSSLQRSNTSPAALSPSRPSFAPQLDNEVHATLVGDVPHNSTDPRPKNKPLPNPVGDAIGVKYSGREPRSSSPAPQTIERNWSPDESHLTLDSPTSYLDDDDDEDDIYNHVPFVAKPKLEEPHWQMIAAPHYKKAPSSVSGSSSSQSDGHSSSTSASSISITSTPHSVTTKHVQIQSPPAARRNRSATTSSATRPRPAEVSNAAFGAPNLSTPILQTPSKSSTVPKPISKTLTQEEVEREERLKSAADISIARQISVSRQQRQLLIPIKKSSPPVSKSKSKNPNFPHPSPLNINRVTSPLGVVAAAADPESPIAGAGMVRRGTGERMLSGTNPSTPTLVVVGGGRSEAERLWGGTMSPGSESRTGSGEIRVGLAISSSPLGEMGNRKSERVVFETIPVN